MKKSLTFVFTMLLGASLSLAQTGTADTAKKTDANGKKPATSGDAAKTTGGTKKTGASTKKSTKNEKGKKSSGGQTTTQSPK